MALAEQARQAFSSLSPLHREDSFPEPAFPPPILPTHTGFGPWLPRTARADRGLRRRWEAHRLAPLLTLPPGQAGRWLADWGEAHPPFRGEAWMDGLEMATRLVRILFGLARAGGEGLKQEPLWIQGVVLARAAGFFLHRSPIPSPPAMNHALGEAAARWILATTWPRLPEAEARGKKAHVELARELSRQMGGPGAFTKEQSTGYQRWNLSWLQAVKAVSRGTGRRAPAGVESVLEEGLDTLCRLTDPAGRLLSHGDDEDSFLLGPLPLLPQFTPGRVPGAEVLWMTSPQGEIRAALLAGPCGDGVLSAHGHADALSLLLWVGGVPVLVDPGTGTYRPGDPLRAYFRGTSAHPTVTVDGQDQAESGGAFLWTTEVIPEILEAEPARAGARHRGYVRLGKGTVHTREVEIRDGGRRVVVRDRIRGVGPHRLRWYWPLGEGLSATRQPGGVRVTGRGVRLLMGSQGEPFDRWEVERSWLSREYEVVKPGWVVVTETNAAIHGEVERVTVMDMESLK